MHCSNMKKKFLTKKNTFESIVKEKTWLHRCWSPVCSPQTVYHMQKNEIFNLATKYIYLKKKREKIICCNVHSSRTRTCEERMKKKHSINIDRQIHLGKNQHKNIIIELAMKNYAAFGNMMYFLFADFFRSFFALTFYSLLLLSASIREIRRIHEKNSKLDFVDFTTWKSCTSCVKSFIHLISLFVCFFIYFPLYHISSVFISLTSNYPIGDALLFWPMILLSSRQNTHTQLHPQKEYTPHTNLEKKIEFEFEKYTKIPTAQLIFFIKILSSAIIE